MADLKPLRHHPMVEAWITFYQRLEHQKHEDCNKCGFPHSKHLLCGRGSTFGELLIGKHRYFVDASNVESFIVFREKTCADEAFHWRDDIFFSKSVDGGVKVTFYTPFNNNPHKHVWNIPDEEWKSIIESLETQNNNHESTNP